KVNPLVNWIWFGFAVMAIGTAIALLPESAFAFATSKLPAGAATTTLLLMFVLSPVLRAQENMSVRPMPKTALERQLEEEIQCTCGCRRSVAKCGMPNCEGEFAQRAKIHDYVA